MIRALSIFLFVALASGCIFQGSEVSRDEVARSTSPTGTIDAVLLETNGGATTSFGYVVVLVPAGEKPEKGVAAAKLYGSSRSDSAYGANMKWEGPQDLAIEYFRAKSPPWAKADVEIGSQTIHVKLRSEVIDQIAEPGGMLYNLQKREHR